MKVYIDLGMNKGIILKAATKIYRDFDKFIGFEPIPQLFEEARERLNTKKKVTVINKAVGTEDKKDKIYVNYYAGDVNKEIGPGSSLIRGKTTGYIDDSRTQIVSVINFSKYVIENFSSCDYIILKIDIEGEEYDLLNHMISTGSIKQIDEIYCEWHYQKLKKSDVDYKTVHKKLIKELNELGFDITGNSKKDEFRKAMKEIKKTIIKN